MNLFPANTNYIAIIAAALASMAIGGVWYSPMLFGKQWIQLMGYGKKEEEKMKQDATKAYALSAISSIIIAYVMSLLIPLTNTQTVMDAVQLAFILWLGLIAAVTFQSVAFEGKSKDLFILNNAYNLISLIAIAVILTLWK